MVENIKGQFSPNRARFNAFNSVICEKYKHIAD